MTRKLILTTGIILMAAGILGFFLFSKLKPGKAGLQIETNPQATVFIDGEQKGVTPFELIGKPSEVTIRLVPTAVDGSLAPWGTKITLTNGINTVIRRDFGETETESAGEILSFDKLSDKEALFTVVSVPDAAQITVDGQNRGFSPVPVGNISVGEHTFLVSQAGFNPRQIHARAEAGYKLTIFAMLSSIGEVDEATDSASLEVMNENKIEILDTPTGFLRVRANPSTGATESAQVKPGEEFVLLEEKDAWYKIEYQKDKSGWVSSQYAKKVE